MIQPELRPGAPIFLLGEAPGEQEVAKGLPFVGASGQELRRMLSIAGIEYSSCSVSNVFLERPPNNDLTRFSVSLKEARHSYALLPPNPLLPKTYIWRAVERNSYLDPHRLVPALLRLRQEILEAKPNLVVAMGNTACIALGLHESITKSRGTVHESPLTSSKVLPTFHPAAVLRQWELRPIVIADLMKAKRHSESAIWTRPQRTIHIPETPEEAESLLSFYQPGMLVSVDTETKNGLISTIGFSHEPSHATVIPFLNHEGDNRNYWPTHEAEVRVFQACRRILKDPAIKKLMQNGLYDVQYFLRVWRCPVYGFQEDTMLLHHAMFPELKKDLGTLGSLYTDEPSWKTMHHQSSNKREE